jgi:hypothetical protein
VTNAQYRAFVLGTRPQRAGQTTLLLTARRIILG